MLDINDCRDFLGKGMLVQIAKMDPQTANTLRAEGFDFTSKPGFIRPKRTGAVSTAPPAATFSTIENSPLVIAATRLAAEAKQNKTAGDGRPMMIGGLEENPMVKAATKLAAEARRQ